MLPFLALVVHTHPDQLFYSKLIYLLMNDENQLFLY